jgi:hypothetical protein
MVNYYDADRCADAMDVRDRRDSDFIVGLHKFIDVAKANKVDNFMPCPCVECRNVAKHSASERFHARILLLGHARRKRG